MNTADLIQPVPTSAPARRAGLLPALAGALVGLPFAGLSLYWAAGGTRFLAAYGGASTRGLSLLVGVLMPVGFALVVRGVLIGPDAPRRTTVRLTAVRLLAWMSAGWMALAGLVLSVLFGLLALTGSGSGGSEHLLGWHAVLWDPWLLLTGLLLLLAMWRSAAAYVATGRQLY